MTMESHGGVADQMTNLALELPEHGIRPIILVRNPLAADHVYAALLRQGRVPVWAVTRRQQAMARGVGRSMIALAFPLVWLDALLRRKTVRASRQSAWGLLRRVGYAALDGIFWVRLLWARVVAQALVAHFRKPDGWQKIIWAKRLGFRTVYTEDVVPVPHTRRYYTGLARAMPALDAVTAVSNASKESIRDYCEPGRRIPVIANMVAGPSALEPMADSQPGVFVVGSLARLAPQKNIRTLLLAVQVVMEQRLDLRFLIYGDGPQRGELEALAQSLDLAHSVEFAGAFAKGDLSRIMAGIDLVVLSSVYEGFGVVLVEGMAHGKPAVATGVGGVPEVVVDGVTGLLVPPESPEELAEAILRLASDRELYRRMAGAARKRYLQHYAPDRITPQYVAIYKEVAEEGC
jgi:glycosyltransferase involved in cell wall biosynthesis